MKKNKVVFLTIITVMLFAQLPIAAVTQPAKGKLIKKNFPALQFCLRGGLNLFMANGANGDYVAGANDFPVTPAYQSQVAGFGFAFFTSRSFAVGLDVRYGLSAQIDLLDPSDGEIITVDTPENLTAVINFTKYFDLSRRWGLYVSVGGGLENLMVEEKEYLSNRGNKIIIAGPEKALSPLAAGALGVQAMLSRSLGLALDFQAAYVFREKTQLLLSPSLALVFKF
jgi:hypothetical protein